MCVSVLVVSECVVSDHVMAANAVPITAESVCGVCVCVDAFVCAYNHTHTYTQSHSYTHIPATAMP